MILCIMGKKIFLSLKLKNNKNIWKGSDFEFKYQLTVEQHIYAFLHFHRTGFHSTIQTLELFVCLGENDI